MYNVELVTIGDEILSGITLNTNATWLAEQLQVSGYSVRWMTTIADIPGEIESALDRAGQRADIIISTGGLGPTPDDTTREALAHFFNAELLIHHPTLDHIRTLFEARGLKMPDINRLQAMIPEGAEVIDNPVGTAPALLLRRESVLYFFLPGVPTEMKNIFSSRLIKILEAEKPEKLLPGYLLRTAGLPESRLAEKIADILDKAGTLPVSFLPKTTGVDIRIRARSGDDIELLEKTTRNLRQRLSRYIYADKEISLSGRIGQLLMDKKLTLAVAESFTGGLISDLLTDIPGSSAYYLGGLITYSNDSKIKLLGVRSQTIEKFGSVSEETALEMVSGVKKKFNTICALSSTGIAGPTGATPGKPLGLCYLAAIYGSQKAVKKFIFGNDRRMNKERGAAAALELLRRLLIHDL